MGYEKRSTWNTLAFGEGDEDGFLGVQAVFGLLENGVGVGFEDFLADFFSPVSGQAVENHVVFGRLLEQLGIDLEPREFGFFFFLSLLPHGQPDIGVDDVGAFDGLRGIGSDFQSVVVESFEEIGWRLAGHRRGDGEFEVQNFRCPDPGAGHVGKTVADESEFLPFPATEFFFDCQQIGKNLARMLIVREGIDDGKIGVVGEIDDVLLGEGTDDHAMDHSAEHTGGVFDGLAAAELDVVGGEEHGKAAEFTDANLK